MKSFKGLKSTYNVLWFLLLSQHLLSQPLISSFSPASGAVGTSIVINGTNFNPVASNNIVYFGVVKATVTTGTTNSLTVIVPGSATYGPISVTTNGLSAYSENSFVVTFPSGEAITSSTFAEKTAIGTGESPYDIAAGDFDGDGKPDMVTVNGGYPYSISVYKNTSIIGNGIISFADKLDIPTGIGPFGVAVSDIDNDGKLDIIVANYYSFTISVFRNTGTPGNIAFASRVDLPASNPDRVAVADLNKDGKPDLIVTNSVANSISIFRNTGSPGVISFAAKTDYATGDFPDHVTVADIDGDSWKDIVVTNGGSNYISIFKNVASPGISLTVDNSLITNINNAGATILADLDGDNKPELTVGNGASVSIYSNTSNAGTISFLAPKNFATSSPANGIALADLDGDGNPDLAVLCESQISVLKNTSSTGSISFQPKIDYEPGDSPYTLTIADFDGDNKPDLATVNQGGNQVTLLRSQLGGPHITSFSPAEETEGGTVTITGTGFVDITEVRFGDDTAKSFTVVSPTTITAVVNKGATGEVSVKGSKGRAKAPGFTFRISASQYPPPVIAFFAPISGLAGTTVTITGQNFDSVPGNNIVYFGGTRAIILSASATQLTVKVPTGASPEPITVTTHLLTGYSASPFICTFQTGPAFTGNSFSAPQLIEPYSEYGEPNTEIASADIDGDGKTDLVYGHYSFKVARNTSTVNSISFATPQTAIPDGIGSTIEFADMDGDGRLDLVTGAKNDSYNGYFSVFRNQSFAGNISFVQIAMQPEGDYAIGLTIKDLDLDGKPDVIVPVREGNYVSLYRNMAFNGAITFAPRVDVPTGIGPLHVSCGDLDGDGKPELIVTSSDENSISIFPNNSSPGNFSFGTKIKYTQFGRPQQSTLSDFDGDGKLDIAVVAYGGQFIVYKNTSTIGSISFTIIGTYGTYSFPTEIRSADMNGDGKPDIVIFSEGMHSISVFKNTTTSAGMSFGLEVYYTTADNYGEVEIGDYNGDGKNDMVTGAGRTGIGIVTNKVGIAKTIPAGAKPVQGEIKNRMTLDQTVQSYNGAAYVQRHYDIEPVNDPATSTAVITLYFNQEDFDNFNASPAHGLDLPKTSIDASGIANVRVYQYHGFSATSQPGTYTGAGIEINPADANIVWNVKAGCWEVTFNVTGFSGFFVGSAGSSILPVRLLSFTGHLLQNQPVLRWETAQEINTAYFELQRQYGESSFTTIATLAARGSVTSSAVYEFTDITAAAGLNSYRLKMVDIDGKTDYSKTVTIRNGVIRELSVFPNPAHGWVMAEHAASGKARISITSLIGHTLIRVPTAANSNNTRIDVHTLSPGVYILVWENGADKKSCKIIIK